MFSFNEENKQKERTLSFTLADEMGFEKKSDENKTSEGNTAKSKFKIPPLNLAKIKND
jgi:hypothetical protein